MGIFGNKKEKNEKITYWGIKIYFNNRGLSYAETFKDEEKLLEFVDYIKNCIEKNKLVNVKENNFNITYNPSTITQISYGEFEDRLGDYY